MSFLIIDCKKNTVILDDDILKNIAKDIAYCDIKKNSTLKELDSTVRKFLNKELI